MAPLNFRPSEDVASILQTLHEVELDWVAEEIEASIRSGKLKEVTYSEQGKKRSRKTGYKTIPYDENEQLEIVLYTIRNYFIVLYDVWSQVQRELPESLNAPQLNIQITNPDTDEPFQPFTIDYIKQRSSLEDLIQEALSDVTSWNLRSE